MGQLGQKPEAQFQLQLAIERFETSSRNFDDYMKFIIAAGKCFMMDGRGACTGPEIEQAIKDALRSSREE